MCINSCIRVCVYVCVWMYVRDIEQNLKEKLFIHTVYIYIYMYFIFDFTQRLSPIRSQIGKKITCQTPLSPFPPLYTWRLAITLEYTGENSWRRRCTSVRGGQWERRDWTYVNPLQQSSRNWLAGWLSLARSFPTSPRLFAVAAFRRSLNAPSQLLKCTCP